MSENQTQIYGVSLPLNIAHHARVVAAMQGKSRSGLMRDLLLNYLKEWDEKTKRDRQSSPPITAESEPQPH